MLGAQSEYVRAKNLRVLLWGTGILGLIWVLTGWILERTSTTLILAGLGLAAGAVVLATLNNWRSGVYLFLVWLLFEDLARKYLGNNMAIYFGKDVLVGVTYLVFWARLRRGREERFRPRFLVFFSLFFWLGVIQVFNPSSPSFLYGLLGLKLYFYYFPLLFVGYALICSGEDLHRFLIFNLVLAGVIALLGVVQAMKGPDFLNPPVLAPELEHLGRLYRMAPETGEMLYRPTSVFVSDGRFAWYLILVWILGLGAAGYLLLRTRRGRKTVYLAIALVAAAIVLSGSRGSLTWAAGSALVIGSAFLWGAPWRWKEVHRLVKAIRWSFTFAGVGLMVMILFFPSAVGARWDFYSETLSPQSRHSELVARAWDYPVQNLLLAFDHAQWPYGYGIGTASLGVQYVSRLLGQGAPRIGVESGFGALIVEMGILAPILWLAWALVLLRSGWLVIRRLKETPYFPAGFAIYWFAFLLLIPFTFIGLQPYQNFVYNAYFWLLTGVLFRLPTLLGQDPVQASNWADSRR